MATFNQKNEEVQVGWILSIEGERRCATIGHKIQDEESWYKPILQKSEESTRCATGLLIIVDVIRIRIEGE